MYQFLFLLVISIKLGLGAELGKDSNFGEFGRIVKDKNSGMKHHLNTTRFPADVIPAEQDARFGNFLRLNFNTNNNGCQNRATCCQARCPTGQTCVAGNPIGTVCSTGPGAGTGCRTMAACAACNNFNCVGSSSANSNMDCATLPAATMGQICALPT